ncbi:MAG: TatD family hydrolase [Thiogranum sp.]|jgi:TatD DNase family protein
MNHAALELVDTHCHLDVSEFDADRDAVIARAQAAGVCQMVVPAVDAAHWQGLVSLCRSRQGLYPALGMHPVYWQQHRQEHLGGLAEGIETWRPVAVGEIGLDFFIAGVDREVQRRLFAAQLDIARDAGLPVILHVRKAHDDVLAMLKRHAVKGGIAHAFNGSLQQAHKYLEFGFKLGFGGMLTYERSRKIRALAKALPMQAIVLETDAPDMTVASHHGERNSPEYLPECLQALAEVRDEAPELLARQSTDNARDVLGLPR